MSYSLEITTKVSNVTQAGINEHTSSCRSVQLTLIRGEGAVIAESESGARRRRPVIRFTGIRKGVIQTWVCGHLFLLYFFYRAYSAPNLGALSGHLVIGQLRSHETNRRRVSDNNNTGC